MSDKISKTFKVSEEVITNINEIAEEENITKTEAICKVIENFNINDSITASTSYKNIWYNLPAEVVQILEEKAKLLGVPDVQIIRLAVMQYAENKHNVGNNKHNDVASNDNNIRTRNRASQKQRVEFDKLLNDKYFSTKD